MMRILVTGCRGMLGRRVTELLEDDYDLFGCDLIKNSKEPLAYHFTTVDLTQYTQVKKYLNKVRPDAVIHLAAKTQVDDCELKPESAWKANSLATQNLLKASKKWDPVFFYLSTDYVFLGKKKTPYQPSDKIAPPSVYGKTKAEGEAWVRRLTKKGIIVRTAWLYGPEGPNFVNAILDAAQKQPTLKVVDDQKGCPTFTRGLALALTEMLKKIQILPKIPTGIYHYTGKGETTWFGFAKEIIKMAGLKVRVKPITSEQLSRPAPRPSYSLLDMRSLKRSWQVDSKLWKESLFYYLREKGVLHESSV